MSVRECKKIVVVGNNGSGKTTFATKLAEILGLPLIHLDAEFWQPGWKTVPREHWIERINTISSGDEWIIDGQYGSTLKQRFIAADCVIFMDISRPTCFKNLVKRRFKYHSKPRPDMPEDCPEIIRSDELVQMWNYPKSERNRVLSYMIRYPKKEMHTFYSLKAANQWLEKLENKTLENKEPDKDNKETDKV